MIKIPTFEEFFNNCDVSALQYRINKYFMTVNPSMSYSDIWREELFTLFGKKEGLIYFYQPPRAVLLRNDKLYRARKIKNMQKINSLEYDSSYWEKSKNRSYGYGRLNTPGENNLYFSDNIATCIFEVNYKVGDLIILTSYDVERTIELNNLLFESSKAGKERYLKQNNIHLNNNGRKAFSIYGEFKSTLFNLNGGINNLGYKQSNAVAKMFYSRGSNVISDGWVYESYITNKESNNYCLKPINAHNNLKLTATILVKVIKPLGKNGIRLQKIALREPGQSKYNFNIDEHFEKLSKEYFPQFNDNKS